MIWIESELLSILNVQAPENTVHRVTCPLSVSSLFGALWLIWCHFALYYLTSRNSVSTRLITYKNIMIKVISLGHDLTFVIFLP